MPINGRSIAELPAAAKRLTQHIHLYIYIKLHQYTLPKTERLYLRESISDLFANGASFTAFPYRIVYIVKDEAEDNNTPSADRQGRCAIMAIAPKKRFKHAVDRNRVKRLTREAYRLQKLPLLAKLEENNKKMEVAFLYVDNKHISFDETYAIIGRAIKRLIRSVNS